MLLTVISVWRLLQATWKNLCGVDLLNIQRGKLFNNCFWSVFVCVIFERKLSGQLCMVWTSSIVKKEAALFRREESRGTFRAKECRCRPNYSTTMFWSFFFCADLPFSPEVLISQIRKYMFKKNAVPNWILR